MLDIGGVFDDPAKFRDDPKSKLSERIRNDGYMFEVADGSLKSMEHVIHSSGPRSTILWVLKTKKSNFDGPFGHSAIVTAPQL